VIRCGDEIFGYFLVFYRTLPEVGFFGSRFLALPRAAPVENYSPPPISSLPQKEVRCFGVAGLVPNRGYSLFVFFFLSICSGYRAYLPFIV